MDGSIRTFTTSSTFHSLSANNETTTSDHAPLTLIPSSSSRASSVTVNGQDDYAQLQPTVHTHGWKPETMQPAVLLALALACVLLAALLEILAQKSAADGALCLVDTAADIPPLVSFAHLYLPAITAVLYSLAWNWVDLDVKRMQPWLQLSRSEGATGRDSMFLDYPGAVFGTAPVLARHTVNMSYPGRSRRRIPTSPRCSISPSSTPGYAVT
ncbi:hypothetical protein BBO_04561 [Beauveria brongniartii RCEF 3172]|uniref:Uncharacterized protein n=1 Tax=Beauveria brongniartii RCEF 3172 TaxID=1081107 RepID=A0A162JF65_9HYPO|nr:hypothetical protein BBO_04561 [Beauveria brongniartii RCEF 3172]